jgi:hypothetical protein
MDADIDLTRRFINYWLAGHTRYDSNNTTCLKGYNINPDAYAVINKQSIKTVSVPFHVKKGKR